MRMLLKAQLCTEAANEAIRNGTLGTTIKKILDEQKPEAAYFVGLDGKRTALLIVNVNDASGISALVEPWFLSFNAVVELRPVMVPEDLANAMPSIDAVVKRFG